MNPGSLLATVFHRAAASRDGTDRRAAEAALLAERARLNAIFESSPVGMLVLNEQTEIVRANKAAVALTARSRSELLGMRPGAALGCTHSTDDPRGCGFSPHCPVCPLRQGIEKVIASQVAQLGMEAAVDLVCDGVKRQVWLRAGAEPTELDGRKHVVVAIDDITASKQAEQALRESEERLRTIGASTHDAILMMDHVGSISFWNQAAEKIFGYPAAEAIGKNLHALLAPSRFHAAHAKAFPVFCATGQGAAVGKTLALEAVRKDGREVPVEVSLSPVMIRDRWHAVGIIRDITERKRADEALRASNERLRQLNSQLEATIAHANEMAVQAECANAAKSEFLANMSHEIRTPLNGVIGMTGLLLDTDLTPEQRQYAEIARFSGQSLLGVIDDILDFSKLEARKLDLETLHFDLRRMLEDAADILALRAHQKGLEFACVMDPAVPSLLRGDPGRLQQVLVNLMGNAVKFTSEGEVSIRVSLDAADERRVTLRLSVADTGIGIPADRLDALFAPFVQVDGSTTRKYGGTGLGLAISRQLVELMGGRIGVESRQGKGSTFWFTAVLERQPGGRLSAEEAFAELSGVKVLVVDDCATIRLSTATLLNSWSCRVAEAAEGITALDLLSQAARNGDPFRIALIDTTLPGVDGEELGRRIKADPTLHATSLLMLAPLGRRDDAARWRQIGFAGSLSKPIRRSALSDRLMTALGCNAPAGSGIPTEPAAQHSVDDFRKRQMRILVAEDNPTNQAVALSILKKLGYRADAVANGKEVLKALADIQYDIVLMDCQMPEMDGYQATRRIRAQHTGVRNPGVPIVAMTAHAMCGDREECLEAGMNDYLSKPVQPEQLAKVLARWLAEPTARPLSGAPPDLPPATTLAGPREDKDVLDEEQLMTRLMGDWELGRTIIAGFMEDMPVQIGTLRGRLEAGDRAVVQRQAHTIKGAAATIGAGGLRAVALGMEQASKAADMDLAAEMLPQLEKEFERVRIALDRLGWVQTHRIKGEVT